jgi:methylmalonyl-CoA/ethylmalonyl-CoA epimerase
MKVNKVDHICIAVKNLDQARKFWELVLGKSKPDDAYIDEPEKDEWCIVGSHRL